MKMSTVNIKMHHWKCNGLKIQTEIKIPAWGKHYNQNKVVSTFFFSFFPVEAVVENSAWRQQVVRLAGNANCDLLVYFPLRRMIAKLWSQQHALTTDVRQCASCCHSWNAEPQPFSQLDNMAKKKKPTQTTTKNQCLAILKSSCWSASISESFLCLSVYF